MSQFYDPMIAKLIATGATRDEALDRLETALDAFVVDARHQRRRVVGDGGDDARVWLLAVHVVHVELRAEVAEERAEDAANVAADARVPRYDIADVEGPEPDPGARRRRTRRCNRPLLTRAFFKLASSHV